jgi:GMP synthase-like glutamine amidotransferase
LQHVAFEGLGSMEKWARERGHALRCSRLFAGDALPSPDLFDLLIVMGGPMGVHDEERYPWLRGEKDFLRQVIAAGSPALGVCLGAQLLADALGAQVTANKEKEIGWFPVERGRAVPEKLAGLLPERQTVFHWHGDTFTLPEKAIRLYSSAACVNHAFVYEERLIGLQFHLETTPESVAALVANCRPELVPATWIQTEEEILAAPGEIFGEINNRMGALLDYLVRHI